MQSTIEHFSKRTRQYWLIDGLAEIFLVFYLRKHQGMGEEIQ
jgi:hypothetical protein